MKHGINGASSGKDVLATALEQAGKTANEAWREIQAWQGKEVPADLSYTTKKAVIDKIKGR